MLNVHSPCSNVEFNVAFCFNVGLNVVMKNPNKMIVTNGHNNNDNIALNSMCFAAVYFFFGFCVAIKLRYA